MTAKKNILLGTVAASMIAVVAAPAFAADAVMEQPPAPPAAPMETAPVATWAGPYAGIALGYGFSGETNATDTLGATNSIETDGFLGSGFAGWNGQSGSFVYGVEGDVGYNGMDGGNAGLSTEGGVDGSLRARLGFAATDNILIYGTAGGAGGRHELSDATSSDTQTMWGWTAGAGVDVKMTERSFVRAEYRYTDLGSESYVLDSDTYDVDATSNKLMLGFGMNF